MRSARISGSCPRTRPVEIGNADGAEEWDAARPDDDAGYGLIVLINKVPRRIAAVVEGDTATPIFARQTVIEITRDQLDIPAGRRGTPLQDDRFVALRPVKYGTLLALDLCHRKIFDFDVVRNRGIGRGDETVGLDSERLNGISIQLDAQTLDITVPGV